MCAIRWPQHADDLIGRPEDGKFCDPTVYSNALTWGPLDEVIAFIRAGLHATDVSIRIGDPAAGDRLLRQLLQQFGVDLR